jgi:hypothetical protein
LDSFLPPPDKEGRAARISDEIRMQYGLTPEASASHSSTEISKVFLPVDREQESFGKNRRILV